MDRIDSLRIFLTDLASSDFDQGMDAIKLKGNPEIEYRDPPTY